MDSLTIEQPPKRHGEILQEEYRQIFDHYLPPELLVRPGNLRMISVACGFGLELKALQNIFPAAHIEGIDFRSTIMGAKAFNPTIPSDQLHEADATEVTSFGSEPWDIVILRNPHVGSIVTKHTTWGKIISNCVEKVANNGYFYLTTTTEIEMNKTLNFLNQLGKLNLVVSPQQITIPFKSRFPLQEHFIAIFQKSNLQTT